MFCRWHYFQANEHMYVENEKCEVFLPGTIAMSRSKN